MKVKQIARLLALILTLVTMVSCLAVILTINTPAITKTDSYLLIPGSELASANEINDITTNSTANGIWSFTTKGKDPYVNVAAMANVGDTILRTYPYVVVRYKTSQFTSMEIFCGHPGTAHRRVSLPCPPTGGQWGCLFYDFSSYSAAYRSWFRLEVATASGINMEIAEVVLFKNSADITNYRNIYVKAGTGSCTVLTFNDFGDHGGSTGRNGKSTSVQSVTEVRPDNNDAMFNEGGYFTRLTSNSGGDGYISFTTTNTTISAAVKNYKKIAVRYRANQNYNGRIMQIFFGYSGGNWKEEHSVMQTIYGEGDPSKGDQGYWSWLFFTKPASTNPKGVTFDSIRFDYMTGQGFIDVAEIYFYNDDTDIYSAEVGKYSYRNKSNSTWFNSNMYMLQKSSNTYFESQGTCSGGQYSGYHKSATGETFDVSNKAVTTVGRTFYQKTDTHAAHDSSIEVSTTAATCLAAPTKTTNCSLCGDNPKTTTTGSALKHNSVDSKITKQPTCSAEGVLTYYCTNGCGQAQKTEAIPKSAHTEITLPDVEATYITCGKTGGTKCSVCQEILTPQTETDKEPTMLTYNVALNEKFAVNVKFVYYTEDEKNPSITVVNEAGETYEVEISDTGDKHTDGHPIYSVKIADISARDIGHVYTVTDSTSGGAISVSIQGYCMQVDDMCAGKTEADLTNYYKSEAGGSYTESTAQALAKKTLLAHDTTQKITVYGQAAENYFNPGDTTDKHTALAGQITAYTPQNTTKTASNTGDVKFMSATVLYGDEIELVFIMDNYNREKIFVNDKEIPENEINSHLFKTVVSGKEYICFAIAVKPDEFSKTFTVRAGTWVMGEDGNNYYAGASTASYSVDTYIASMQQKYAGKSDAQSLSTVNLVNALGTYGHSASTYAKS